MVNPPYPPRKFFEGFAPVVVLLMVVGGPRSGLGGQDSAIAKTETPCC